MSIRKFNELDRETDSRFDNVKSDDKRALIAVRFDDSTENDNPYDDSIQYLNRKLDECIDSINTNRGKTTFPGFGTSNSTALRGNTTTISTSQANAIIANSAKTGITSDQANAITANSAKTGITNSQASAITANTAKRDAQYIYIPVVCNFYGDLTTGEYHVPFSDGETESTSTTNRRNQFVAPCDGNFHKVIIRSNNSTLERGAATRLTVKSKKVSTGGASVTTLETKNLDTAAAETPISATFDSTNSAFSEGDRLLLSLQLTQGAPRGNKSFFVTVVFKIDQADLD